MPWVAQRPLSSHEAFHQDSHPFSLASSEGHQALSSKNHVIRTDASYRLLSPSNSKLCNGLSLELT